MYPNIIVLFRIFEVILNCLTCGCDMKWFASFDWFVLAGKNAKAPHSQIATVRRFFDK